MKSGQCRNRVLRFNTVATGTRHNCASLFLNRGSNLTCVMSSSNSFSDCPASLAHSDTKPEVNGLISQASQSGRPRVLLAFLQHGRISTVQMLR